MQRLVQARYSKAIVQRSFKAMGEAKSKAKARHYFQNFIQFLINLKAVPLDSIRIRILTNSVCVLLHHRGGC